MEVEAAGAVGDAVGEELVKGRGIRWGALALGAMIGGVLMDAPSAAAQGAAADTVLLTLNEAVSRAVNESEEVRLARARVRLADAQVRTVRSQALPQVNLSLGYTKTLASAFDTGGGFELPDSLRFAPDTTASLEERVSYLERAAPLAGLGGISSLFGDLPFGQENAYTASVSGSQVLYSGGRVGAALSVARSFRSAAGLQLAEERAEIELEVRRAYWRARLAQELEGISLEALAQAERFLVQEQLRLRAGRASQLEVMRAEVERDNLRPQLVQARNAAELAVLNLKRLVDIPLDRPVRLATELEAPLAGAAETAAIARAELLAERAAILAAEERVSVREDHVRIARAAFLPDISLRMAYGRQLFPEQVFDLTGDWRTDWTVSVGVQLPLFTGFRRGAELDRARVELEQARLQLGQVREGVQMEYERAVGERERARQAIAARERTVEVAQRVYELTVLRYSQGLATQLEVSDARLALLRARTHLAQAVSDFYIADAELARVQVGPEAS